MVQFGKEGVRGEFLKQRTRDSDVKGCMAGTMSTIAPPKEECVLMRAVGTIAA